MPLALQHADPGAAFCVRFVKHEAGFRNARLYDSTTIVYNQPVLAYARVAHLQGSDVHA